MNAAARGEEVLRANRAARDWAAGLRRWSTSARESSTVQRARAVAARSAVRQLGSNGGGPRPPGLPGLGSVRASDLVDWLVQSHDLTTIEAERAIRVGMLAAGYPADYAEVSAVDAFDVLETAARHRS
jgi:hypothetical protein